MFSVVDPFERVLSFERPLPMVIKRCGVAFAAACDPRAPFRQSAVAMDSPGNFMHAFGRLAAYPALPMFM